jgi:pimeloyl-ACP methyl ester carboxylesterase
VLGAAAHSDSVAAVAIYEPVVIGVGGEDDTARLGAAMQQVGAAAADGRILDAVHAFLPGICTDNEIAALEETPFYEQWSGGIPAMLRFLQYDMSYEGPRSTDPEALGQVAVPVLLLRGEQTLLGTLFADVERYVAQHVVDAYVRELPGVGHFAPLLEPEPIAKELISFFESVGWVQRARDIVPPHATASWG